MSKSKNKTLSFEESIAQLEGIIERIESGEIGLEESLTQYERGVQLAQHCRTILAQVEKKITELSVDQKGNLHDPSEGDSSDHADAESDDDESDQPDREYEAKPE